MAFDYEVGDIVKLKKKHPCGAFEWEILRVGADFRLKCVGCGHQIMVPAYPGREEYAWIAEKNRRKVKKRACFSGCFMLVYFFVIYFFNSLLLLSERGQRP